MFDYKTIVTDKELTTSFVPSEINGVLNALDNASGAPIGTITIQEGVFEASSDDVFTQYKLWQTRPERKVGTKVDIAGKNLEELTEIYEELFIGAYLMQTGCTVTGQNDRFARAIDWLRTTDFYTAPASSHYHDAVPGGLLVHSLKVYNQAIDLLKLPAFSAVSVYEITLVALMHDWCKINYYESFMKNVKDESTGEWHKEPAYRVNQKGVPLGHGAASMFLASRIITLSVEEALAIRWHMAHWNVADKEEDEYQNAIDAHPIVFMIQIADQLACNSYAN